MDKFKAQQHKKCGKYGSDCLSGLSNKKEKRFLNKIVRQHLKNQLTKETKTNENNY